MSALVGHRVICKALLSFSHCCHFHSLLGGHLLSMKVPLLGRGTFQVLESSWSVVVLFPNANGLPLGLHQTQNHFGAPLPQLPALRSGGGSCKL